MAARKKTTTSVHAAVSAMMSATQPWPDVPGHVTLSEEDRPFWDDLLRARAKGDWLRSDLVVVAQLARCQGDIERESASLKHEGSVLENARGTMVANPRAAILEQLARREMALMRTLRLGGRVSGDVRDDAGRRDLERRAEAIKGSIEEEDSLLA